MAGTTIDVILTSRCRTDSDLAVATQAKGKIMSLTAAPANALLDSVNTADELEALLTGEYGLRKDYVSIQNKLDKKKKK